MANSFRVVDLAVTQESCRDSCLGPLYCLQGCAPSPWGLGNVSSHRRQGGGLGLQVVLWQEEKLSNRK